MTVGGLPKMRTESEIARNEHPSQRLQVGDAAIRFAGRDPDLFDRITNLCAAMRLVADEVKRPVEPRSSSRELRLHDGGDEVGADKIVGITRLLQIIADDMKRFSQKDEETWALIGKLRSLASDIETWDDMGRPDDGGVKFSIVRGLRGLAGDLMTHVERRRGF